MNFNVNTGNPRRKDCYRCGGSLDGEILGPVGTAGICQYCLRNHVSVKKEAKEEEVENSGQQLLVQITIQFNADGSFGFLLPAPLKTVRDRAFIVGILQSAVLAASSLALQENAGLLVPPGIPLPDFRKDKK